MPADRVRGIVNVTGNSCFLNAVLQALAPLPPLHAFLRHIVSVGDAYAARRLDALAAWHARHAGEGDGGGGGGGGGAAGGMASPLKALGAWGGDGGVSEGAAAAIGSGAGGGGGGGGDGTAKHMALQILRMLSCLSWPCRTGLMGVVRPLVPTVALGEVSDLFNDRNQHDAHELLLHLLACLDDDELARLEDSDADVATYLAWPALLAAAVAPQPLPAHAAATLHPHAHPSTPPPPPLPPVAMSTVRVVAAVVVPLPPESPPSPEGGASTTSGATPTRTTSDTSALTMGSAAAASRVSAAWVASRLRRSGGGAGGHASFARRAARMSAGGSYDGGYDGEAPATPPPRGARTGGSSTAPVLSPASANPMRGISGSRIVCQACALPRVELTAAGMTVSPVRPSPHRVAPVWVQEAFMALSLSPSPGAAGAGAGAARARRLREGVSAGAAAAAAYGVSVEGMLACMFTDEAISGYECENPACGHINYSMDARGSRFAILENNALRQHRVIALPPVLVLHVRRADYFAGVGHATKASTHVDFGLSLDMAPYTLGAKARGGGGGAAGGVGGGDAAAGSDGTMYDLMSVVQHLGSTSGAGHYITYRRVPAAADDPDVAAPAWVRASDAAVEPVSAATVLAAQAYLLFYVRRDVRMPPRIASATLAVDGVETVMLRAARPALLTPPPLLLHASLAAAAARACVEPAAPALAALWRAFRGTGVPVGAAASPAATAGAGEGAVRILSTWAARRADPTAAIDVLDTRSSVAAASSGDAEDQPPTWSASHATLVWYPTEY